MRSKFLGILLFLSSPCFASEIDDLKSIIAIQQQQIAELKNSIVTMGAKVNVLETSSKKTAEVLMPLAKDYREFAARLTDPSYQGDRFKILTYGVDTQVITLANTTLSTHKGEFFIKSDYGGRLIVGSGLGMQAGDSYLTLQTDNNFVLYTAGRATFATSWYSR